MRALVKTAPGKGHVDIVDMPLPTPARDELLIKVKYCGICGTDLHIHDDEFPNDPPVIMGHEFYGQVVGGGDWFIHDWTLGQPVVGELHTGSCLRCHLCLSGNVHICDQKEALGSRHHGAFAEYLTLPARLVHAAAPGVAPEVAALSEPFAIAGHCLVERGKLPAARARGARNVLITGAATMGLMSTIWAARLGYEQIIVAGTAIDEAVRFPLAPAMGATTVVNVERQGLREVVLDLTGGRGADVWVECSGSQAAIRSGVELVKKTGTVVLIGLVGPELAGVPWNQFLYRELDLVGCFSSPWSAWQLALQAEPEEEGRLRRLATHILPLSQWREGFELLRSGQAVKVLLDLEA
ncbi:MAG: zinc-dependent alcohol dehydrogenase [Anaerolineae bacterium]|jgi:L-iditol 2-dehydrogenase